jgi:hypothetical protein
LFGFTAPAQIAHIAHSDRVGAHFGSILFTWCLHGKLIGKEKIIHASSVTKYNVQKPPGGAVQLKTFNGKMIEPSSIDHIMRGRITGVQGTLVKLKTGEEVFLQNSEEEVVEALNLPIFVAHSRLGSSRARILPIMHDADYGSGTRKRGGRPTSKQKDHRATRRQGRLSVKSSKLLDRPKPRGTKRGK